MRTKAGVGYIEDHQGSHLEPTAAAEYPKDSLDDIADELGLVHEEAVERLEGHHATSHRQRDPVRMIAPLLLSEPNLRVGAYGLLMATDSAALGGISMERAGIDCAKLDGAKKHVDDLSHRHHILASFLEKKERERWLEIARNENLSASEFKASLAAGVVVRLQGVTRAAISKSKRKWQRLLGDHQTRVGKSPEANKKYRISAFRTHHKADFKRDFEAVARASRI